MSLSSNASYSVTRTVEMRGIVGSVVIVGIKADQLGLGGILDSGLHESKVDRLHENRYPFLRWPPSGTMRGHYPKVDVAYDGTSTD